MKIFLEDKTNALYLTKAGEWSMSASEALDFPSYDRAVEFAVEHSLRKVQVVLKFEDYPYNILLPLQKPTVRQRATG